MGTIVLKIETVKGIPIRDILFINAYYLESYYRYRETLDSKSYQQYKVFK